MEVKMKHRNILFAIVILALIPLLFISFVWIREGVCPFFIDYNLDQWIGIMGAILAYIGTGSLGILALWQNEKVSELSRDLQYREIMKNTPKLSLEIGYYNVPLENVQLKPPFYIVMIRNVCAEYINMLSINKLQISISGNNGIYMERIKGLFKNDIKDNIIFKITDFEMSYLDSKQYTVFYEPFNNIMADDEIKDITKNVKINISINLNCNDIYGEKHFFNFNGTYPFDKLRSYSLPETPAPIS